jgi:hypothetical protein
MDASENFKRVDLLMVFTVRAFGQIEFRVDVSLEQMRGRRAKEQVAEKRIVTISRSQLLALGLQVPGDTGGLCRQRLSEVPQSAVGAGFSPSRRSVFGYGPEVATNVRRFESKSGAAYNRGAALTARSD